jgi:hypothetical protein
VQVSAGRGRGGPPGSATGPRVARPAPSSPASRGPLTEWTPRHGVSTTAHGAQRVLFVGTTREIRRMVAGDRASGDGAGLPPAWPRDSSRGRRPGAPLRALPYRILHGMSRPRSRGGSGQRPVLSVDLITDGQMQGWGHQTVLPAPPTLLAPDVRAAPHVAQAVGASPSPAVSHDSRRAPTRLSPAPARDVFVVFPSAARFPMLP